MAFEELSGSEAALLGLLGASLFFIVLIGIIVYVYMGFAYMAIARKAKLSAPGIAWIPSIGPNIIAFRISKMHWWPWILFAGFFIPVISVICSILFTVFTVIWHWKLFEKVGRPGWWAILWLIPIVNLVLVGIAAWGKSKNK